MSSQLGISSSKSERNPIKGTTNDGRDVLLYSNGTWEFTETSVEFTKSFSANQRVVSPIGNFAVWIDPTEWKYNGKDEEDNLSFESIDGVIGALMIPESTPLSMEILKEIALLNARESNPDAKIIYEQNRVVNRQKVLCLKIEMSYKNVPIVYYGYYYTGESGTVQLLTWSLKALLSKNEPLMTKFLNGLIVNPEGSNSTITDAEPTRDVPGLISFGQGHTLSFDPNKWTRTPSDEKGTIELEHKDEMLWATIIFENEPSTSEEMFKSFVEEIEEDKDLSNLKITEKRKIKINGVEGINFKLAAARQGMPLDFYIYFGGNDYGTVSFLTVAFQGNLNSFEKDITELLNGLRINQ